MTPKLKKQYPNIQNNTKPKLQKQDIPIYKITQSLNCNVLNNEKITLNTNCFKAASFTSEVIRLLHYSHLLSKKNWLLFIILFHKQYQFF